jgi:DGQHR domain-containing protein
MNDLIDNIITGKIVNQIKQEFIVSIFTIEQIFKFTRYTQRILRGFDEDNLPIYNDEVQRETENNRVEKIADFLLNNPEATFPTNIVLSIPSQVIDKLENNGDIIKIYLNDKVFKEVKKNNDSANILITIIDGQHRIKGIEVAMERLNAYIDSLVSTLKIRRSLDLENKLEYFSDRLHDLKKIELVVTFFIDKSLEYQAMIFSTINRTQKRVPQNLVYSLFGLTSEDSPQKTALEITFALNGHKLSPFYDRIKLYGYSYEKNTSPPLTQATMVKSIIDLICENLRESENDRFRKREALLTRITHNEKQLPFRLYYAKNQDEKISDILFYFFSAVRETFKKDNISLWEFDPKRKRLTNILQTTVGYQALIKILVEILDKNKTIIIDHVSSYSKFLVKAQSLDFIDNKRYPFANKTKNILYLDMSLAIWHPKPDDINDKRKSKLNELLNEK